MAIEIKEFVGNGNIRSVNEKKNATKKSAAQHTTKTAGNKNNKTAVKKKG